MTPTTRCRWRRWRRGECSPAPSATTASVPATAIDRKTMAVWIVRVLDGDDPPALAQTRFNDVDAASFYASFIERMAELEVTTGCGDRSGFCPDRSVTRAQMAAFLSRAYKLPDGPDPGFGDVPADAWYAPDVARLAASGITVGCGDRTVFCPSRDTTRAQMATFLHRAENRAQPTTPPPYKAVDSGLRHACAVRSDNTVTCWGYNEGGQVSTPDGEFLTVSSGQVAQLRAEAGPHHLLLGLQRRQAARRPGRRVQRGLGGRCAQLRTPDRRDGCLLGHATGTGRRRHPAKNSHPCTRPTSIPAGCAPTARSPAGAATAAVS